MNPVHLPHTVHVVSGHRILEAYRVHGNITFQVANQINSRNIDHGATEKLRTGTKVLNHHTEALIRQELSTVTIHAAPRSELYAQNELLYR